MTNTAKKSSPSPKSRAGKTSRTTKKKSSAGGYRPPLSVENFSYLLPTGENVTVTVTRKRVKNIHFRLNDDHSLRVTAPPDVSVPRLRAILDERVGFMIEKKANRLEKGIVTPTLTLADGETFSCFGQSVTVRVTKGRPGGAVLDGATLFVTVSDPTSQASLDRVVQTWQKTFVRAKMEEICRTYFSYFSIRGVSFPRVDADRVRSVWGTCYSGAHRVRFSTAILLAPLSFAEYVAVHELAHFLAPNHSAAFWAHVAAVMPDYRARRALAPVIRKSAD